MTDAALIRATRSCWRKCEWDKYGVVDGVAKDRRCENCMVHCGYEPTASLGLNAQARRHLEDGQVQLRRQTRSRPGKGNEIAAYNGVTSGNGHLTGKKR